MIASKRALTLEDIAEVARLSAESAEAEAVYRLVEEHLGVPRTLMGFVSSNGWDAAGAKAFGFQVFWVNRARAPVERLGVRPDETIASLAELVELLK